MEICVGSKERDFRSNMYENYKEEKRKIKNCINKSKKESNKQFIGKMNQEVIENRKIFWKK